jgi:DNA/RNA-binding domain of Phe-tRNA-synthetase-like protein
MPEPIISPAILERFPHYRGIVIYAFNIENRASDHISQSRLRYGELQARLNFSTMKPAMHPHIAAWREAFIAFGARPNKTLNSAEALISRILKDGELPSINWLTDMYNSLSASWVLPIGGEDLDKASGLQRLEFASGLETFDTIKNGEAFIDSPQPGEVIWRDNAGVTCRAWNWRQCVRTRLTEQTRNAYFVLDSLSPFDADDLDGVAREVETGLKYLSPDCTLERFEIGTRS